MRTQHLRAKPHPSGTTADLLLPDASAGRWKRALRTAVLRATGVARVLRTVEAERRSGATGEERFMARLLKRFGIAWTVAHGTPASIPRTGGTIVIANHPFGAAEGMILHEIVHAERPDTRTMAAYQLRVVPELQSEFIFVDAVNGPDARRANLRPMADTVRWLEAGGTLVLFPAGAISQYSFREGMVLDPVWYPLLAGLVRRCRPTVVPTFVHGGNSLLFRAIGYVLPKLSTLLLAREILNKRGRTIGISIGEPVSADQLLALGSDQAITAELRARSYAFAKKPPRPG
ncbi:MAG TPA: hypothetical protein VHI13_18310 [Candidatus Kapabacteria bacterium]|nr:hypothetical protein [Candidatus Kapabacteria bacterium]